MVFTHMLFQFALASLLCQVSYGQFGRWSTNPATDRDYDLGTITFSGGACTGSTCDVVKTESGDVIIVLVPELTATTNKSANDVVSNFAVEVEVLVSEGKAIGIAESTYVAEAKVPVAQNNYAALVAQYSFAGESVEASKVCNQLNNFCDKEIKICQSIPKKENIKWSECGKASKLYIAASVIAHKGSPTDEEVDIVVPSFSADGIKYKIVTRDCGAKQSVAQLPPSVRQGPK